MEIAIVSSLFPPYAIGGAEQVAAQLAAALHQAGHQVDVITTYGRRQLAAGGSSPETRDGIRIWQVAPWNLYWSFDKPQVRPGRLARACWHAIDLWNPTVVAPLRKVLDQIEPDVVNTHNIDGLSPAIWPVAHEYTPCVVHTLHDCHLLCPRATMQRPDGAICERLCRLCSAYAAYHRGFQKYVRMLIAPSQATAELHRIAGWTGAQIEIIRNGVDIHRVAGAEALRPEPLRVLFLSRLEREKGCETLLAAIAALRAIDGIEFHVAGSGSMERAFSAPAARMPHVHWHGFVSGVRKDELLSRCDVFLQLSECRENAPLSLIEAKRHGLYLLGTAVGGVPELIEDSARGLLIPPADRESLLAALRGLGSSKDAIRAGRESRMRSSGGHGTREMAQAYAGAFQALLDSSRAITKAATSHG